MCHSKAPTMKKNKTPQLNLFNPEVNGPSDVTAYKLYLIAPEKGEIQFNGPLSFDKAAAYIRDNKASGIIQHQATEQRAQFRSGRIYNINLLPVINDFSPPWFTVP